MAGRVLTFRSSALTVKLTLRTTRRLIISKPVHGGSNRWHTGASMACLLGWCSHERSGPCVVSLAFCRALSCRTIVLLIIIITIIFSTTTTTITGSYAQRSHTAIIYAYHALSVHFTIAFPTTTPFTHCCQQSTSSISVRRKVNQVSFTLIWTWSFRTVWNPSVRLVRTHRISPVISVNIRSFLSINVHIHIHTQTQTHLRTYSHAS
jgi:hypothetical protein